jgi:hypothetical protein
LILVKRRVACVELGFFVATLNQWHCAVEVFRLGERNLQIAGAVVTDIGHVPGESRVKLHARRIDFDVNQKQLANLKASGDYGGIIERFGDELVADKAAQDIIELANKAVEAAKSRDKTFDFEGVSKYLTNASLGRGRQSTTSLMEPGDLVASQAASDL